MSKNYTQLSLEQRYQIEALIKAGIKQNMIADQLGVNASTISRELGRNTAKRGRTSGEYLANNAHRKTLVRHQQKAKQIKFTDDMKSMVVKRLKVDKWSPEFISADGKKTGECMVSHECIYTWIWTCKQTNLRKNQEFKKLYEHLKHGKRRRKRGKRRDSRGLIKNRIPIEKRPKIVSKRKRLGDVEVDLMMGKDHKGAVLVMTDRATLHTKLKKLKSKSSKIVKRVLIDCLSHNLYPIKTLTFDNDQAFSSHEEIAKALCSKAYFTRPYTSQDKGTVENRIGILRRFFPKKTDLTFVSHADIRAVEKKLNNRPVRKFNYLTPNQVLLKKLHL